MNHLMGLGSSSRLLVPGELNAVEEEFLLNVVRTDPSLLKKHKEFIRKLLRKAEVPG